MNENKPECINVFRINLDDDTVSISVGSCDPININGNKIPSESVKEVSSIRFPISLLPGIAKQLIELGVSYQQAHEDIGFELGEEENGVKTVRL